MPVQLRDPVVAGTQEKYRIGICYGCGFKVFTRACVLAVVVLLLMLSGDVELNPGPPKLARSEFHFQTYRLALFLASYIPSFRSLQYENWGAC